MKPMMTCEAAIERLAVLTAAFIVRGKTEDDARAAAITALDQIVSHVQRRDQKGRYTGIVGAEDPGAYPIEEG